MPDEITGVEETAAAGQDTLFTKEDFMGTGVEEAAVAEQEEPEETEATEPDVTEPEETQGEAVEKAFAERLKHATKKIREEVKEGLMQEMTQRQAPPQGDIPSLPHEEAERLADQYGTSPEVVRAMYAQQALIARQQQDMQKISGQIREQEDYVAGRSYADAVRKQNPNAPAWDEQKLKDFREDYHRTYGVALTWRDTYRQMVAEEALNPATYQKITRQAQQETIKKITAKDKDTVKIQGQTARKPSIDDLTDEEFERLKNEAKEGKYLKEAQHDFKRRKWI